jgi:hypothetical protein
MRGGVRWGGDGRMASVPALHFRVRRWRRLRFRLRLVHVPVDELPVAVRTPEDVGRPRLTLHLVGLACHPKEAPLDRHNVGEVAACGSRRSTPSCLSEGAPQGFSAETRSV